MNVKKALSQYYDNVPCKTLVMTKDAFSFVQQKCGQKVSKRLFSYYTYCHMRAHPEYISVQKGIYYKKDQNEYVEAESLTVDAYMKLFCRDDKEVYGYPVKELAYQELGILKEPINPKDIKYSFKSKKVSQDIGATRRKNVVAYSANDEVKEDTVQYFFILDVIEDLDKVPHTSNALIVIADYIRKNYLSWKKLISYSRYYKDSTLLQLASIAFKMEEERIDYGN